MYPPDFSFRWAVGNSAVSNGELNYYWHLTTTISRRSRHNSRDASNGETGGTCMALWRMAEAHICTDFLASSRNSDDADY
jgi:hypothetical protein